MTAALADFLLARITEDEAAARKATRGRWKLWGMTVMADQDGTSNVDTAVEVARTVAHIDGHPRTFDANHIARWDPARVLADCKFKRRLVEAHHEEWHRPHRDLSPMNIYMAKGRLNGLWTALRLAALPYADHPDYQSEWKL